jgi:hypothetical protein
VPPVERHRISGEKPPHQGRKPHTAGPQQKMGMVEHEHPGITGSLGFGYEGRKALDEIMPVLVVHEYTAPLNTADHHVVQSTGSVESGLARHTP